MKELGLECEEYSNTVHRSSFYWLLKFELDMSTTTPYFPTEIAEIPKIMDEHSSQRYNPLPLE